MRMNLAVVPCPSRLQRVQLGVDPSAFGRFGPSASHRTAVALWYSSGTAFVRLSRCTQYDSGGTPRGCSFRIGSIAIAFAVSRGLGRVTLKP